MRQLAAFTFLILLTTPALAERVFNLKEGEDVSRLLYERLKISTIYRNGLLQEVLKFNDLTDETAKKLPVNTPIRLPDHIVISVPEESPAEVIPEETVTTEIPEKPSTLNITKWFSLGLKPAILTGDAKDSSTSFSMVLLKASAEGGVSSKTERHEVLFGVGVDFAYLQKDEALKGNNSLFLADTNLIYRYLVKTVWLGLHFNFGQRMIFSPKPDERYEFLTPWLYGIGPTLAWNNFTMSYLLYPEQTVESGVKTQMNQGLILGYELRENNHGLKFSGTIFENSTEAIYSKQLELGARYVWYF